jgi:DNA polymerase III subunit delta'
MHPRLSQSLYGHESEYQSFVNALQNGKLHHAWMLYGPRGIGKATFAYKVAKLLLSGYAEPDKKTISLVENGAHPDLFVLESLQEGEISSSGIKVEEVRKLLDFLRLTPALSKRKVIIIDSVDQLNTNGANALLKALEEPSLHTTFLLISNSYGAVPPTIRSRCSMLKFKKLTIDQFKKALTKPKLDVNELYDISNGSLYMADLLMDSKNLDFAKTLKDMVVSGADLTTLLEVVKKFEKEEMWECFIKLVMQFIADQAKDNVANLSKASEAVDRYYDTHSKLMSQEIFNLDKSNVATSIITRDAV